MIWLRRVMRKLTNDVDLEELHAEIWGRLRRAASDRRSHLRWVNLATIGLDGLPHVRTVILRGVLPRQRILQFHTDRRSAKFAELSADYRLSLHFHDRKVVEQIRSLGFGAVAPDEEARQVWTNLHQGIRETYLQAEAPSLFLVIPRLSDQTAKLAPNEGFANFAVINVSAVEIDWLLLGGGVHKRVKFKLAGPQVDASWVHP
mgnify:CR=1 FL=1